MAAGPIAVSSKPALEIFFARHPEKDMYCHEPTVLWLLVIRTQWSGVKAAHTVPSLLPNTPAGLQFSQRMSPATGRRPCLASAGTNTRNFIKTPSLHKQRAAAHLQPQQQAASPPLQSLGSVRIPPPAAPPAAAGWGR